MSTVHDTYQDLMVDVLFEDASPEEERRLKAHLETCDVCADEFASLQKTLSVTAQRERPEPPEGFWDDFDARLYRRIAEESASSSTSTSHARRSWTEGVRQWWNGLPVLLPQTGGQWALQGAMLAAVLLVGVYAGQQQAPSESEVSGDVSRDELAGVAASQDGQLPDLLLAGQTMQSRAGTVRPSIANVEDITYDVATGTVEVRYNMVNDVVVRGKPGDPTVQRLLRAALLDEQNPSSQLHAVKTLEASGSRSSGEAGPDPEVVRALTYLARSDDSVPMRIRAVRALGAMHRGVVMPEDTRGVLLNILKNADEEVLRIEALDALTMAASPSSETSEALYRARADLEQPLGDTLGF